MSVFSRAGKRLVASVAYTVGQVEFCDKLIVDAAMERVSNAANKAIAKAGRHSLKDTQKEFNLSASLTLSLGQIAEDSLVAKRINNSAKSLISKCKKAGVKLDIKIESGYGQLPATIVANFRPLHARRIIAAHPSVPA